MKKLYNWLSGSQASIGHKTEKPLNLAGKVNEKIGEMQIRHLYRLYEIKSFICLEITRCEKYEISPFAIDSKREITTN